MKKSKLLLLFDNPCLCVSLIYHLKYMFKVKIIFYLHVQSSRVPLIEEGEKLPLIIGHRGYAPGEMNQNSLSAFKNAIKLGADGIECDVRQTKDGKLVVIHDPIIIHKMKIRRVHNLEYRELVKLIGSRDKAPLLSELVRLIPDNRLLFIELKASKQIKEIVEELHKMDVKRPNFWFMSYKYKILQAIKNSQLRIGYHPVNPFQNYIKIAKSYNAELISPLYWFMQARITKKIQKKGMYVVPWTINKVAPLSYFIQNNVDAIYTNELRRAMQLKKFYQN